MTWGNGERGSWKFYSVNDVFENGVRFIEIGAGGVKPNYKREQVFLVVGARTVRSLTKSTGALQCTHNLDAEAKSLKKKKWSINLKKVEYRKGNANECP